MQNKEQEAKEQAKLRIKQMEMQRKDAMRRGGPMGGSPYSSGGGFGPTPSYASQGGMGGGSHMDSDRHMGGSGMGGGSGSGRDNYQSSFSSSNEARSTTPVNVPTASRGMQLGGKKDTVFDTLKQEDNLDLGPSRGAGIGSQAAAAAPVQVQEPLESVQVNIEEKIIVVANRDGGIENMEVKGDVFVKITDPELTAVRLQFANVDEKAHQYRTHPNIDKKLFSTGSVIGPKDPSKPFPVNLPLGVLKWRYTTKDEMAIPLLSAYIIFMGDFWKVFGRDWNIFDAFWLFFGFFWTILDHFWNFRDHFSPLFAIF